MGQPVKLSDKLVLDARIVGETTERSIAGQVEFMFKHALVQEVACQSLSLVDRQALRLESESP